MIMNVFISKGLALAGAFFGLYCDVLSNIRHYIKIHSRSFVVFNCVRLIQM